jgi:hypothetical protein
MVICDLLVTVTVDHRLIPLHEGFNNVKKLIINLPKSYNISSITDQSNIMRAAIQFSNVKRIMIEKYNVKLYDWDGDFEARKGKLVGKSSFRHDNDQLVGMDDDGVAKMFAGLANSLGGNVVSVRGVSITDTISETPYVFVLSKKQ